MEIQITAIELSVIYFKQLSLWNLKLQVYYQQAKFNLKPDEKSIYLWHNT